MCQDCLLEQRPDRGTTCLDDGSYVVNFKSCVVCGKRKPPQNIDRIEEVEDNDGEDEIETTYTHTCTECGHRIASHFHRETSSTDNVRYLMECFLCGKGAQEKERYRHTDTGEVNSSCAPVSKTFDQASIDLFHGLKQSIPNKAAQSKDTSSEDEWDNEDAN